MLRTSAKSIKSCEYHYSSRIPCCEPECQYKDTREDSHWYQHVQPIHNKHELVNRVREYHIHSKPVRDIAGENTSRNTGGINDR